MIHRGGLYWVDLGEPVGSRPGERRPVLVVQSESYNRSRLATVLAAIVTSNTQLAAMPGNVFPSRRAHRVASGFRGHVTALVALNKDDLEGPVGQVSESLMREADHGLRRVLGLREDRRSPS